MKPCACQPATKYEQAWSFDPATQQLTCARCGGAPRLEQAQQLETDWPGFREELQALTNAGRFAAAEVH